MADLDSAPTRMSAIPMVAAVPVGGAAAGGAFGVVAHQQERQHGGGFPEDVEQQHVVADHEAEHRAGEGELGGEAGQPLLDTALVVVEVLGAVEEDECADGQHQHAHDRGQRIEAQRDVHGQLGDPWNVNRRGVISAGPVHPHPDQ